MITLMILASLCVLAAIAKAAFAPTAIPVRVVVRRRR